MLSYWLLIWLLYEAILSFLITQHTTNYATFNANITLYLYLDTITTTSQYICLLHLNTNIIRPTQIPHASTKTPKFKIHNPHCHPLLPLSKYIPTTLTTVTIIYNQHILCFTINWQRVLSCTWTFPTQIVNSDLHHTYLNCPCSAVLNFLWLQSCLFYDLYSRSLPSVT